MKRLNVIQIGLGHDHACAVLESMLRQKERFRVCALALPECEREKYADRLAPFADIPLLTPEEALALQGTDAAVIETEEKNLTRCAAQAIGRGLHVHMDKPGGETLSDFEALISAAKRSGKVLHLGYMYRYNPAVRDMMKRVRAGELGEIFCVEAQMNCALSDEKRAWLGQFRGGMMFYLGCHMVDVILQIKGKPREVIPMNCATGIGGIAAKDFGMAALRYENGVCFAKTCGAEASGYLRRQIVVCGSKGTIELNPLEAYAGNTGTYLCTRTRRVLKDCLNWAYYGETEDTAPFERFDGMMAAFGEYAAKERENPFGYDYELLLYRTLLQCCGDKI